MENLSNLKLNSRQELRDLMQVEGFYEFAINVYNYFETMKPGTMVRLNSHTGTKLEWVIKTACLFIVSGDHFTEYDISEDFTRLRRRIVRPQERAWYRRILHGETGNARSAPYD